MHEIWSPTNAELDRLARELAAGPAEGYPARDNCLSLADLAITESGIVVIPDDPRHLARHPGRQMASPEELDPEVPSAACPTVPEVIVERCRILGATQFDQFNRPINPEIERMLSHPGVRLAAGPGYYYGLGDNPRVVVIMDRSGAIERELLLVRQRATGRWAPVTGYVDPADAIEAVAGNDLSALAGEKRHAMLERAARREVKQETGLSDIGGETTICLSHRPARRFNTVHSYTGNHVVYLAGDASYLREAELQPRDDAMDARWFTVREVTDMDESDMNPIYRRYIAYVLKNIM